MNTISYTSNDCTSDVSPLTETTDATYVVNCTFFSRTPAAVSLRKNPAMGHVPTHMMDVEGVEATESGRGKKTGTGCPLYDKNLGKEISKNCHLVYLIF